MGRRILISIVLVVFAACAIAVAQQRKAVDEARFGSVDVKRTESHVMRPARTLVIPWHVNYQGYLTDDAGNPINDTLSMRFSIWDAASVGTELWNETQNVVVEDAIFNVILGSITPIPSDVFGAGLSRWLELMVEAQTLSPRTEITSVGYAYRSVKTDSADYALDTDMVDGFDASVTPTANDLFPLSYGDGQYVNEGQADAIDNPMIVDGTILRADVDAAFKAPYSDTADYAFAAPVTPDNDWTITGNVLHPTFPYGLAMRGSNVLHGTEDITHVNLGIACTTGTSGQNYAYCTVSGGYFNAASSGWATVAGGSNNRASAADASVGGGFLNTASGLAATVGGGYVDTASGDYATVGGGWNNTASGTQATVGGGTGNVASGNYATVGGGQTDTASGEHATVAGGLSNIASTRATVGGGQDNTASGTYATVCGGYYNIASGYRSTVGGGYEHLALGDYATVGGGSADTASADYATVAGGYSNTAATSYATIGGGVRNTVTGATGTVGGGQDNAARDSYTTVGGGSHNIANGTYVTVAGGYYNTATGYIATVAGGYADTVSGDYSFATGREVKVTGAADHTFAFGRLFATSTPNAVIFHNSVDSIRVGIANTAPTHLLDVGATGAYCDGGAWIDGSSREYKERIVELTLEEAAEAVAELTPVTYNFRSDKGERCVGFIAEDVPGLVATKDRKGLSPMDIVATLTKVVQNQQKEIESLRKEIDALKRVNY